MPKTSLGTIQQKILMLTRVQTMIQNAGSDRIKFCDNEPTGKAANAYNITRHDLRGLQDAIDEITLIVLDSKEFQQIMLATDELSATFNDIMQAEKRAIYGGTEPKFRGESPYDFS